MTNDQATGPEGIPATSASASTSAPNMMVSAPEDPFAAVLALARVTLTSVPASASPPGPGDDARVGGTALPDEWHQDPEHPDRCIEAWRLSTSQKYGHEAWKEWHRKGRRVDPDTGKDNLEVKVKRIEDVWECDNPTVDTPHQFARGIDISRKAEGIEWQPHRLLGPDPGARAPISTSQSFLSTSELPKDFLASTSRGHQPKIPRPSRVGAGWGDHDKFREWQLHGRALTKDMVEDKAWAHQEPATLPFVPGKDAEEDAEDIVVTASLARDDLDQPEPFADRQRPRTVLESFEARRFGEAAREGRQRGGGQRGRGRGRRGWVFDDSTW
ncbi:hypothetical protein FSOLCH5_003924 [Fusarium solani]